MKKYSLALLTGAALFAGVGAAYAATQIVTSDIKYVTDLSFVTNAHPVFGYVKQGQIGNYVLSTSGTVTPNSGGVLEGGTTAAGDYTIIGSATQAINITAGSYTSDGGSAPSAAVCAYDGGADVPGCSISAAAPPDTGKHLKVGLTIASAGTTADGITDHPTFTLTVLYQ